MHFFFKKLQRWILKLKEKKSYSESRKLKVYVICNTLIIVWSQQLHQNPKPEIQQLQKQQLIIPLEKT